MQSFEFLLASNSRNKQTENIERGDFPNKNVQNAESYNDHTQREHKMQYRKLP